MDDHGLVRITTPRLRLRSWRWNDAALFEEACNTAAVMRWLGGVQSPSELRDDVAYFMASEFRDGVTFWVVERAEDQAFLGFCGLIRLPDADCPCAGQLEIGWRLRESAWRQGYGFEAASAVLCYAFSFVDAAVVVSRTAAGNIASQGLMSKLGFSRWTELDYVPVGEREKLLVWSIFSGEWHALRSNPSATRDPSKLNELPKYGDLAEVDVLTESGEWVRVYEWLTPEQIKGYADQIELEGPFRRRAKGHTKSRD